MKDLIERNYQSIVKRGLITNKTKCDEFIDKIYEEVHELNMYANGGQTTFGIDELELADIILVCLNMAKHFNIDIEKVLNEKIKINEQRAHKNI